MLVLLSVDDIKRRRGLMRIFCPATPPAPKQYLIELNSVRCIVIQAKRLNGKLRWNEIAKLSYGRPVIMPPDVFPPGGRVIRYDGSAFFRRVLFNTAEKIISQSRTPERSRKISVLDPMANCTDYVIRLAALAGTVRVHTQNRAVYERCSEECYDRYGAQIIITNEPLQCYGFDFAVAPFGEDREGIPSLMIGGCTPKYLLVPDSIRIAGFSGCIPHFICRGDFISALYEHERYQRLGYLCADYLVCHGYKVFTDELCHMVKVDKI